jgi:hypothetical protein
VVVVGVAVLVLALVGLTVVVARVRAVGDAVVISRRRCRRRSGRCGS